jgi:hypothetical protein
MESREDSTCRGDEASYTPALNSSQQSGLLLKRELRLLLLMREPESEALMRFRKIFYLAGDTRLPQVARLCGAEARCPSRNAQSYFEQGVVAGSYLTVKTSAPVVGHLHVAL